MADIKEVIDMMVADGRPEEEIVALIDRYNKDKQEEPGKTTDPAVAEPIVGSENTASTGEESSTESVPGFESFGKLAMKQSDKDKLPSFLEKTKKGLEDGNVDNVAEFGYALYDMMANRLPSAVSGGWAEQGGLEEKLQLEEQGADIDDETLQTVIENYNIAKNTAPSLAMKKFTDIYAEENKKIKKDDPEASDWWGFIKAAKEEPGTAAELLVRSAAGQARAFLTSETARTEALEGAVVGGSAAVTFNLIPGLAVLPEELLTVPTMMYMGGIGKLSQQMEIGNTMVELLDGALEGKDFTLENVKEVLKDEDKLDDIRFKSWARGTAIGAIEAITGGIAGKVAKLAKPIGKLAQTGIAASTEAFGGGLGEFAGQKAAGQETDVLDIGFESFAGMSTTPLSAGKAIFGKKAKYAVTDKDGNETKVSYSKMKKFIETASNADIAKANITIQNDNDLAKLAYDKQETAVIESQVNEKVSDQSDRDILVEKQKELNKANADVKKKGSKAVPGAVEKVKSIQGEIDVIIDKYAGVDGRTKDVKARKKAAADVRKTVRENNLKNTIEFLQKNKEYAGKDVVIADDDAAAQLAHDKAIEEYNAKNPDNKIKAEDVSGSDGFIVGDVIVINKDIAGQTGQINVGAHELLHGIVAKHMKGLTTEEQTSLISDFTNTITKDQKDYIQTEIKRRIAAGEDLDINTTEEWLTVFSDGITKGEITFDKGVFGKLKEVIERIFKGKGYNKEFENGKAVYDFLKDYQKSVAAGGEISARAQKLASGGTTATSTSRSMSTPLEAINELIPKSIKTKKDYDAFVQDRRAFPAVFTATMGDGVISNYVKSKSIGGEYQGAIESVQNRLTNFDPEATRADGTTVGPEGFGEFIFANTRFGKLDSKKKLFEAGEKAKREESIDSAEARQIEDKPTTKKSEPKGQKARVLKSLADVNLDNKEIISSTARAEIDALIEQNPKNLEAQITNIIDKEITKAVKAQMGKISNVKGEVVISEEYKAFIALNYENIVQSLDVNTIKNNYKTLFELTEIGKEDRRTRKSDKPSLKKDSNYRKAIFKIETNKAKFTKFFTEGGYTTLLARQKGLANQIAKGIVEDIVNNEIINNSENNEAIVNAELRSVINSLNKQKKEVQGNYNDQIKFSKTVSDQTSQLSIKVQEAEYTNEVFDTKTGRPVDKFDRDGDPWLPEAYENIFSLVQSGNIIPKGTKNNIFRKLMEKLKLPTDKTIGDTFERWYYAGAKEVGLLADGFVLSEDTIMIQSIGSFIRKAVQAPDLLLEFINSVGRKVQVGFEIKATGNTKMGHNKPLVKDPSNPDYKYKKNAGLKGNPKNPKFVNDKLEQVFNNVAEKAGKLSEHLKKEFNVDWKDRTDFIPFKSEDGRVVYNDQVVKDLKAAARDESVTINGDFIANHYNAKGVFYIQIADKGLFYLGSDPLGLAESLGVTKFEGEFALQGRLLVSNKTVKGKKIGRYASIDVEPVMDPRKITSKVGFSLDKPGGWKALKKALKNAPVISGEVNDINTFKNSINFSRSANNPTKGITVLDFDDTLATSKSLIRFTKPDGTKGTLNAEQYASTYQELTDLGYKWDFSEFNKVVDGKVAPLFNKAMKLQGKFGPENMFVLTARPAEAAPAIFAFLQANGLNIPLKNITGLANSTAEAKALWMVDKVSDGYNDFYFADDALQNVQAVDNILEQFDVKRKVQQARVKFSKSMDENFNDILENVTGIESDKRFSIIKGRKRGASKGKFRFFIPPSHEDFVGLLYNFMGKGKEGNAHRDFLEQALVRPLNRANREYDTARQSIANDYKELNKQFPDVKKKLTKKTPDGDFTNEDAIRVYLWNKHGHTIPGLSPTDQTKLVELVEQDAELKAYAETLNVISKQDTYVNPTEGWNSGDIRMDLDDATGRVGRKQYFAEFNENSDVIFSEENLNKIEAGYGKGVRVALEDILYRIKTGRNRPSGSNETVNRFMNFLNGSVGTVMFFNMRSALLQQMSIVNYINFADNNVFAAAKAFANQKQYWKDFAFIFNSDMLKQRRGGIQTDVNGAELAASLRKSKNPSRALISKLLELGFLPTQIGDNIAIATGGATYYRNTINKYVKQGMTAKEAEAAAFTDFQNITQSTQQSARPDMVSMQQASVLGKVILNFQNVTSQFNRLGKKAFQDIYNRRITKPNSTQIQSDISNAARITYYFAVQNMIFYTLQTALFAMMFGDDEDDENKLFLKKKERLINGSIDSVLRGSGVMGAVVATLKNTAIAFARQRDVNYNPDESAVIVEALNLSPVIGIKARQIVNAEKTLNYNKKIIDEMDTFDIDNPQWSAVTSYTQALTNLPLNRLYNKTQNVRQALNNQNSAWERSLMFLGWSQYNLDIKNEKMEGIKERIKSKKKKKTKKKSKSFGGGSFK